MAKLIPDGLLRTDSLLSLTKTMLMMPTTRHDSAHTGGRPVAGIGRRVQLVDVEAAAPDLLDDPRIELARVRTGQDDRCNGRDDAAMRHWRKTQGAANRETGRNATDCPSLTGSDS